jgi:hypothetical protein
MQKQKHLEFNATMLFFKAMSQQSDFAIPVWGRRGGTRSG